MEVKYSSEIISTILFREKVSVTELARRLSIKRNKKVYQQTLSEKIQKGNFKYDEIVEICEILGYTVNIVKNQTAQT